MIGQKKKLQGGVGYLSKGTRPGGRKKSSAKKRSVGRTGKSKKTAKRQRLKKNKRDGTIKENEAARSTNNFGKRGERSNTVEEINTKKNQKKKIPSQQYTATKVNLSGNTTTTSPLQEEDKKGKKGKHAGSQGAH